MMSENTYPVIKVTDLAYVRFRAPDLDEMEIFLSHFGLKRAARTEKALYMRATNQEHHVHITEIGEPAFIGHAFYANSEADLKLFSKTPTASNVEQIIIYPESLQSSTSGGLGSNPQNVQIRQNPQAPKTSYIRQNHQHSQIEQKVYIMMNFHLYIQMIIYLR